MQPTIDDTPFRATGDYDWSALLSLMKRAFAGMEGRIDPPSSLARLTASDLATHPGEIWVIGRPAQACVMLTLKPAALYLGKIAVEPSLKGRGLARRLIRMAEERARELGLPALELQSRVELIENHATFAALGFRVSGETSHEGYDVPTSLTFTKAL
jgi:predicted N-acetyltransferase YhbS